MRAPLLAAAHSSANRDTLLPWQRDADEVGWPGGGRPCVTSALLAALLSRPPSSCLFWKRAAALLLMRARWRLFKATGRVAASPELRSCPRPLNGRVLAGLGSPPEPSLHPMPILMPSIIVGDISTLERGGLALNPSPPPRPQQRRLSYRNLGSKQDARPIRAWRSYYGQGHRGTTPGEDLKALGPPFSFLIKPRA